MMRTDLTNHIVLWEDTGSLWPAMSHVPQKPVLNSRLADLKEESY